MRTTKFEIELAARDLHEIARSIGLVPKDSYVLVRASSSKDDQQWRVQLLKKAGPGNYVQVFSFLDDLKLGMTARGAYESLENARVALTAVQVMIAKEKKTVNA